jgi:hypothetical protein
VPESGSWSRSGGDGLEVQKLSSWTHAVKQTSNSSPVLIGASGYALIHPPHALANGSPTQLACGKRLRRRAGTRRPTGKAPYPGHKAVTGYSPGARFAVPGQRGDGSIWQTALAGLSVQSCGICPVTAEVRSSSLGKVALRPSSY